MNKYLVPCVYILTNNNNTTLYIGVTSNLEKRLYEHRHKQIKGFTSKYNLEKLVYFELTESMVAAIEREKYLKGKVRSYKEALINRMNPEWLDLMPEKNKIRHSEGTQ